MAGGKSWSTLKVPELKGELSLRGLPTTGNKADLVARLQADDKKNAQEAAPAGASASEDEIDWDDDVDASKHAGAPASAPEPAAAVEPEEPAAGPQEPASEPAKTYAPDPTAAESATPAVSKTLNENTAAPAEKPAEDREAEESAPKQDFAANLAPTSVDEEARKRAERAKRFGLGEDSEEMKRAKRAEKFGINSSEIARGLDAALPEPPAKRGRRGDWGDGGSRPANRMTPDWRGGSGRGVRGRKGRFGGGRKGGGDRDGRVRKIESVLRDPAERAKAEARAQRFGGGSGGGGRN